MNKIEKLINELCPNGVEYKLLEECCDVLDNKRKPISKASRKKGIYPYYGANGVQDYVSDFIFEGEFVLVGEDGSVITKNGTPVVNWATGKIWVNNHAHIIKENGNVLLRFLYHFIQTITISHLIHGNIPKLTGKDFKNLSIPVPPMSVQSEIVRILDSFTELTAELTAELTKRKMQYEYYKDKLLDFKDKTIFKTIGEVCTATNNIKWKDTNKNYRYIDLSSVDTETNTILETTTINSENAPSRAQKLVEKDDVLFATTRPTLRRFTVIDENYNGEVASTGFCVLRADKINVLPKWIFYCISTTYFNDYIKQNQNGTAYPAISDLKVKTYKIPVPPIDVQNKIVQILDKFDALVNDISQGIPAEIEARKKQYEYYRNKLLTFENSTN